MDFSGAPPIYSDAMSDTGKLDRMIVERQNERVWENAIIRIGYARDSTVAQEMAHVAECDQILSWSARRLTW